MAYQVTNGTSYDSVTPDEVVRILERCRQTGERIRLHYGVTDPEEQDIGQDWMDEYGVTGRVGRSTGPVQIPILVYNSRSSGGGAILDRCIVRIRSSQKDGGEFYKHPKYHVPS
jgi:hypothetical protein